MARLFTMLPQMKLTGKSPIKNCISAIREDSICKILNSFLKNDGKIIFIILETVLLTSLARGTLVLQRHSKSRLSPEF